MILSLFVVGVTHRPAIDHSVAGRLYVSKGTARVVGKQDREGGFVQICRANDTIQVSAHSVATVWMIGSGSRFRLSSPSTVKISHGSVVALTGLSPKRLPKLGPDITAAYPEETAQAAFQVRNEGKLRMTPCGGQLKIPAVVSWHAYPEAVNYDFSIAEVGSQSAVLRKTGLSGTSISIPQGCLKTGRHYRVSLAANLRNGGCEMAFRSLRILTSAEWSALAKAEKALDVEYAGSADAEIAKADLFEQYLLYSDSLKCLTELARTSPSGGLSQEISKMRSLADGGS